MSGTSRLIKFARSRLALKATLSLLLVPFFFVGRVVLTSQSPGPKSPQKTGGSIAPPQSDLALQRVEVFRGRKVASGEVLLKMREGITPERMGELVNKFSPGATFEQLGGPDSAWFIVRARLPVERLFELTDPLAPFTVRRELNFIVGDPGMVTLAHDDSRSAYTSPRVTPAPTATPDDNLFPRQWGLLNNGQCNLCGVDTCGTTRVDVDALRAWKLTEGAPDVVVGVVDSGVMFDHPDLSHNIWLAPGRFNVTIGGKTVTCEKDSHGFNAILKSCEPSALSCKTEHGTQVAGVLGAEGGNGQGVAGVNWHARMMVLKMMDGDSGTVANAVNAIEFAVQVKQHFPWLKLRVLNNSWEIISSISPEESQALREWIERANALDMLFVAAAGNTGADNDKVEHLPSNYDVPNVVAVAALAMDGRLWDSSNYGKNTVGLAAPGAVIFTTHLKDGFTCLSGTSMAAPFVSGTAALILSKCPGIETAALKRALLDTTDPIDPVPGKEIAHGRLNAFRAIKEAMKICGESRTAIASRGGARMRGRARVITGRRRRPR